MPTASSRASTVGEVILLYHATQPFQPSLEKLLCLSHHRPPITPVIIAYLHQCSGRLPPIRNTHHSRPGSLHLARAHGTFNPPPTHLTPLNFFLQTSCPRLSVAISTTLSLRFHANLCNYSHANPLRTSQISMQTTLPNIPIISSLCPSTYPTVTHRHFAPSFLPSFLSFLFASLFSLRPILLIAPATTSSPYLLSPSLFHPHVSICLRLSISHARLHQPASCHNLSLFNPFLPLHQPSP